MADFFGDSSLFEEFDKDREAEGSFIHYDADNVRSHIIFEGYDSEDNSEADQDESDTLSKAEHGASSVEGQEEPVVSKSDESSSKESSQNGSSRSEKSKEAVQKDIDATTSKEVERDVSWLNDQLYKQAGEEAEKGNASVQQLMFEKNKYRRFAKILDSTRYVPDDESPAVQLLFNNNGFARKYRQQIEQFIKGLLWEEFHSNEQSDSSASEIDVRPGAPSCIDINESLPPSKRTENMRQKHTILGNSQFHKQFLIDFLGWPFTTKEPTRCNQNWEIPLYGQVFDEVYADPSSGSGGKKQAKKPKPSCWNCGQENHSVAECRMPRNPAKIAANRKVFMEQQPQRSEPKFTGPNRYHLDPEIASKFAKFSPGIISDSLREAMGLTSQQLPNYIYKMRLYGYPPGWLAKAKPQESGVSIFDKTGRVTLMTGECLEDGELDDGESANSNEYDVRKIIEYPGFTVPVPLGIVDEHADFQMPPIQQHQLKETLMSQCPDKSRKRKRVKDDAEKKKEKALAKKAKESASPAEGEEGEIAEGDEENESTQPLEESVNSDKGSDQSIAKTASTPDLNRSSSTISLSRDFGTPILVREKSNLPDATKFSVGIEDHINFENLPNSTGTFEKMKNLIDIIRKKVKN